MVIDKTKDQVLHKLATEHPLMLKEAYEALKLDIEINGQLEPVIRYRGKIVDGRHRLRALSELGIETIKCEDLPRNLTLDEVRNRVISSEIRRHETPTQLAVKAYYYYKSNKNCTQKDAAKKFGVPCARISEVSSIVKAGREDLVRLLGEGKSVILDDNSFTTSIQNVYRQVKAIETSQQNDQLGNLLEQITEITTELSEEQLAKIDQLVATICYGFRNESKIFKETLAKKLYKGLLND